MKFPLKAYWLHLSVNLILNLLKLLLGKIQIYFHETEAYFVNIYNAFHLKI